MNAARRRPDTPPGEKPMRHRVVADIPTREIQRGIWPPGMQLPAEATLAERFGISRGTIRESLCRLDRQGYISRQRGARSTVVSATPIESLVNSIESIDDIMRYSSHTVPRIVADKAVAGRLNAAVRSHWMRVRLLRLDDADRTPVGYSEIHIAPAYAEIAGHLQENAPLYQMLADRFGLVYDRVEQTIEAVAASSSAAEFLGVTPESAIMRVRTEFVTKNGGTAEIAFGHFPMKRYRMAISLKRSDLPTGA